MMIDNYKAAFGNFRNQFFTAEELMAMIDNKQLKLRYSIRPSMSTKWDIEQNSRFIEALILGQPHPAFFFDGSQHEWYVLDGKKRLYALWDFVNDRFALRSLYFLGEKYENYYFRKLPLLIKRKIMNFQFEAHILNPGASSQVRYGVYTNLLTRPQKNISNECRSFIFGESFQLIKNIRKHIQTGMQTGFMSLRMRRYTFEDVVGHLLVLYLYSENRMFRNIEAENTNIDVLVNFLLFDKNLLEYYISETDFLGNLNRVIEQIGWVRLMGMKDIHKIETLLSVLFTLPVKYRYRSRKWVEWIDRIWEQMLDANVSQGYLLRDYCERNKFVTQNV